MQEIEEFEIPEKELKTEIAKDLTKYHPKLRRKLLDTFNEILSTTGKSDEAKAFWMYFEEPCDCGSQIRHRTGGNYHERAEFYIFPNGTIMRQWNTCELVNESHWEFIKNPEQEATTITSYVLKVVKEGWGYGLGEVVVQKK